MFGSLGVLAQFAPDSIVAPAGKIAAASAAAAMLAWAIRWAVGEWPGPWARALYVFTADVAIATIAVLDPNPFSGLGIATMLVIVGLWVTFFESRFVLVGHLLISSSATVMLCIRIALMPGEGVMAAMFKLVIYLGAIVAGPAYFWLWSTMLQSDAAASTIDPLTGLHNRRGLLRRASAVATRVVVVVADVDRFKEVNDSSGHAVGDELLVQVGRALRMLSGNNAVAARIGGDEFAVIADADELDAEALAERLCNGLRSPSGTATVSIGVCEVNLVSEDADAIELLSAGLSCADAAMYEAKRRGGDTYQLGKTVKSRHSPQASDQHQWAQQH